MAARNIPELDPISEVNTTDLLLIVDESVDIGTYFKVTVGSLAAFISENYSQLAGNAVGNINMSGFTLLAGNIQCYTEGNVNLISPLALNNNSLYLNNGSGTGNGTIYMDGGNIAFPGLNGSYGDSSYGSVIQTGSFNNGKGASGGLSFICSVGIELNWQAGWLSASYNAGDTFTNINMYNTGFNMQGNPINMGNGSGGGEVLNMDNGSIWYCPGIFTDNGSTPLSPLWQYDSDLDIEAYVSGGPLDMRNYAIYYAPSIYSDGGSTPYATQSWVNSQGFFAANQYELVLPICVGSPAALQGGLVFDGNHLYISLDGSTLTMIV